MKISVLVATYNREEPLIETLNQLKKQTVKDFEVIIVDQTKAHSESTRRRLSEFLGDNRFRYFKLREPHFTKAKNYGVLRAQSGVVLNIDDDLIFGEELLRRHLDQYENPEILAVGGVIKDRVSGLEITGAVEAKFNFLGSFNWVGTRSILPVRVVGGGNMSFRKSAWQEVGGFDENFFGNAVYEDVDFSLRLSRLSGKIIFDPSIFVWHLKASGGLRSFGDKSDWFYQLFANYLYFNLKHFPLWQFPLFILKHHKAILRCLLEGGVSFRGLAAIVGGYSRGYRMFYGAT